MSACGPLKIYMVPLGPWEFGTIGFWDRGILGPWCFGTMGLSGVWNHGTFGTKGPGDFQTMELWKMGPWDHGTLRPWVREIGTLGQWDVGTMGLFGAIWPNFV
jgi:hypothetical protein